MQKENQTFKFKEKTFWNRTWQMNQKFNWLGKITIFPIALFIIGFFHYIFAGMNYGVKPLVAKAFG